MDGLLDFLTTVVPRGACVVFAGLAGSWGPDEWPCPRPCPWCAAAGRLLLFVVIDPFFFFVGGYVLGGGHLPHAWFMFVSYLCALTCVCMTV